MRFFAGLAVLTLAAAIVRAAEVPETQKSFDPVPDARQDEVREAIDAGDLGSLLQDAEVQLGELLKDGVAADISRLTSTVTQREFALFHARLEPQNDAGKALLQFLAAQPRLLPTLMMAVSTSDDADQVLRVLGLLHAAHGDRLDAYAELVTAFCVVWDQPAPGPSGKAETPAQIDNRIVALSKYAMNDKANLRFDPITLPWQLAVYVVEIQVGEPEITWAVRRYKGRESIGSAYLDVPYDMLGLKKSGAKTITRFDYTLPNLQKYGGQCADQAFFATQVGRSLGVPSAVCTSPTSGNIAWVGYLAARGDQRAWNFGDGRHGAHAFWAGRITDPQTRRGLEEGEVGILAALCAQSPLSRIDSIALVRCADLVAPEAVAGQYLRAVDESPGNREAWLGLTPARMEPLPADRLTTLLDKIEQSVLRHSPEFALMLARRTIEGQPLAEQTAAYARVVKMLRARPDLVARARLAQGDNLSLQRPAEALAAYGEVIGSSAVAGPDLIAAVERVDGMLRAAGQLKKLADVYERVWSHQPRPPRNAFTASTPYSVLGYKYLALAQELGDTSKVASIKARLNPLNSYE